MVTLEDDNSGDMVPMNDLRSMMRYYFDIFDGDILQVDEAFALMRKYGYVDSNSEETYDFD